MLKKAALDFGQALAQLGQLEWTCILSRKMNSNIIVDTTGTLRRDATTILSNLRRVCILADLQEVLPEIDRFGSLLTTNDVVIEDAKGAASHLKYRLFEELQNEYYFQVDRRDVNFYGNRNLFGERVGKKFKLAATDIENAGNCLALRQADATVFHLMRAMEIAVRNLSKRLGVTITPNTTWRQMTGLMDDKIKKMPDNTMKLKRRKNEWEAARANLHHVGSVWRNNTMHPATSYTPSQALDVFNAVRVSMNSLAEL
ncbi:hypothetical protein TSA1_26885 [Bradyrhizobium nitroreducens]|uniref:Uncharacterized protein n=1 Tax=Bradyrhizobium nitroreducens TaxID=709803 RepID=A0A2M6UH89_9BRAD|nr:hypothetical protein [Bradyrhizobium nitroreducens]PIT03994.1 hypothetical protein TSA1_26885 [Bradyrhizobium nitroreducens]